MKRTNLSIALYLVLVFASGVAVGAVGYRLYNLGGVRAVRDNRPPISPEEMRRRYVEEMRARLKLNDGQLQNLTAILDDSRTKFRALREKYRPEVHAIQEEQADRIRAILNDGQKAEYEKMRAERERRDASRPHPGR